MMQTSISLSQRVIGTALLSASALFLEIVLTRLFSVLFFPPYVFLIISLAILGIGIGAAISAINDNLRHEQAIVLYAVGASVSTLVLLVVVVLTASIDLQVFLLALLIIPYLFIGLALSALFSHAGEFSRSLYMGDLIGAGIGAILVIPILSVFDPINSILIASLGFVIAGIYFYAQRYMLVLALGLILSIGAFASNMVADWLVLDMTSLATEKPITSALDADAKIIDTTWDAFARTDLVDMGDDKLLRIYVDGGAASIMPSAGANPDLIRDIGFFPFATEQPERVFIVGPGAGLDVWFGLQSGAQQIVAVEVNPASVDMVKRYGGLNGQLYDQPTVETIIDDGRSILRRVDETYDLIYLSQVVTLAAERGGYALSENTIYTVEAFEDYLSHLSDEGQIALKLYDEITLTRAVSTVLSAFRSLGLSDQEGMKHLLILLDTNASPPIPLMLVKKTAFSEDDSLVLGAIARDIGFTPVYLPEVLVQPPLDKVADGSDPFASIIAESETDISASTDNRPYFFQFEYGIPTTLLPLAFAISIITIIGIGFYAHHWLNTTSRTIRFMPIYFACLGIGFIAIEIFVIQQTRLFLGHPTFAVTLVLATFLLGGGMGSGLSQKFGQGLLNRYPFSIPILIALIFGLWIVIWSALSPQLLANTLTIRAIFTVMTLLPITLFMGIPFPFGLQLVGKLSNQQVAVAWAVNGVTSVIGTVLAVILSIIIGFSAVSILGLMAYILSSIILFTIDTETIS